MDCALAENSLLTYLPVASFAIAAGGLAIRFFVPTGPASQHLMAAVFVFILAASGVVWRQERECRKQIAEVATEIVRLLGNDKRTYEEIAAGLRNQVYYKTNAALDQLAHENRVGIEVLTIWDRDTNKKYQITLYYVRTF
jgi:hypothetical protein